MPRARNQYIQEMKERFEPLDRKMMKSSAPAEETITLVDEQQNTATDLEAMVWWSPTLNSIYNCN